MSDKVKGYRIVTVILTKYKTKDKLVPATDKY